MVKVHKFKSVEGRNGYIVAKRNSGKTIHEISEDVGLSERQVQRICTAHKQNGRLSRKKGSGRPKSLTKAQKLRLLRTIEAHFGTPLSNIIRDLRLPCTIRTARNYLRSVGYSYKKTHKMPYLNYQSEEDRLTWAQTYRNFDFSTTIFVDESVFQVGRPCYGWSKIGQTVYKKASGFGPSVNVWAAISTLGKVSLSFYEGTLNQYRYQQLLDRHLFRQADDLWGQGVWVMLEDGATCHTAKSTKNAILAHAGDIIDWPAASPDLNPMENVWSMLQTRVAQRDPQTMRELKNCITEEWENLENEVVSILAESMPNRVSMLIESEGAYVRY